MSRLLAHLGILLGIAIVLNGCGVSKPLSVVEDSASTDKNSGSGNTSFTPVADTRRAILSVSNATGFDFGNITLGGTSQPTQSFIVTNSGQINAPGLVFSTIGVGFSVASTTCTTLLTPASSCSVVVALTVSQLGLYTGHLSLAATGVSAVVVSLRGTAVAQPIGHLTRVVSPDPGVFDQQLVGNPLNRVFYLLNDGNADITNLSIGQALDAANQPSAHFQIVSISPLPADPLTPICTTLSTLSAGARCGFVVRYTPAVNAGVFTPVVNSAYLPISYRDSAMQVASWPLQGSSVAAPVLSFTNISPGNFANVAPGANVSACVTVRNSHPSLKVTSFAAPSSLSGSFFIDGAVSCANPKCSAITDGNLAPNSACDIGVRYSPAVGGAMSAPLRIDYHNGLQMVNLSGNVGGSAIVRCQIDSLFIQIFAFGNGQGAWGRDGSKTFTLPADASNISLTATHLHADDYGAVVKSNNVTFIDKSTEQIHNAGVVPVNVAVPALHGGANTFWASVKNRYYNGPTSAGIVLTGSYYTAGSCPASY